MTTPVLDDLDRRIIGVLSKDARVSNRRIAALLGVTEGTIRSRLRFAKDRLRRALFELTADDRLAHRTASGFDGWAERIRAAL